MYRTWQTTRSTSGARWPVNMKRHSNATPGYLSADELQRAGRLRLPVHRERFIISRGLLRALLGSYLDCRPEAVHIHTAARRGNPVCPRPFPPRNCISTSHTPAMLFSLPCG